MRNLDSWVKRPPCSAPAVLDLADRPPPVKRRCVLRSREQFRVDELIEEVRKKRQLWCRAARGFYSPAARDDAYKRVAAALTSRFPQLPPWYEEEVESHWRCIIRSEFACMKEHGGNGKPHSFTCRLAQMSFLRAELIGCTNCETFVPRIYYRGSIYFQR